MGRKGRAGETAQHHRNHPGAAARIRLVSHQELPARPHDRVRARKDYWGKNLNVNIGRDNFEEIRYDYYRDTTVALEAFKGDQLDFRAESSAKDWATAYDFPAVREGRVIKEEFLVRNQGVMQSFAFNTRREKFKDPRVRRALAMSFDFAELNKTMFYGQYIQIDSYFKGTELAWNDKSGTRRDDNGLPSGKELEILVTVREKVPPEVFTEPYRPPATGSSDAMRRNLRDAMRLLKEAGYEIRDRKLINTATGEQLTVEFLLREPTFERVALFMKPSLERIGVGMTVRTIDPSQYENRMREWDFDITVASWGQSLSPGNEQLYYWGSKSADQAGSRNLPGIKNPAVDAIIERVIFAKDREESRCRDARSRPRADVELLRHSAMDLWQAAHRTLGSLRSPREHAGIWLLVVSDDLVVGRRASRQDRGAIILAMRRRDFLLASAASLAASTLPGQLAAQTSAETHGLSIFGDLKYPVDFKNVDYVDPAAPKGGLFSQISPNRAYNQNFLTFNSLNSYILKGDGAQGMESTFATLMARASDEPDAIYGLAARAVQVSPDKLTYRFLLRPEAKFHDGTPITGHDVAFSLNVLKENGHPIITQFARDFLGAEAEGDGVVVTRFAEKRARDVPLFVATLPIFSRAYSRQSQLRRDDARRSPLGSGPYRVREFEVGRYIEFERVKTGGRDDLPVMRGQHNFEHHPLRISTATAPRRSRLSRKGSSVPRGVHLARLGDALRLSGDQGRSRQRAKKCRTARRRGAGLVHQHAPPKFADPRVRLALVYAFDFEWVNKNIMFGSYKTDLVVLPELRPDGGRLAEAGGAGVAQAVARQGAGRGVRRCLRPAGLDGSGADRALLRRAGQLLQEAGWTIRDGKRRNAKGEHLTIEFLIDEPRLSAAPHAVHQEPRDARHRRQSAGRRCGPVPPPR